MEGGDHSTSLQNNLTDFYELTQRTTETGTTFSEEVKVALLDVLSDQWENLKVPWTSRSDADQTLEKLCELLRSESF